MQKQVLYVTDRSVTFSLPSREPGDPKTPMLTRKSITDAAFLEWGKSCFRHTSLSSLSKALGVTKAALYRHFRGKEQLIGAMEEEFLIRYRLAGETFRTLAADRPFPEVMRIYADTIFRFFAGDPRQFGFYLYLTFTRPAEADGEMRRLQAKNRELLARKIAEYRPDWNEERLHAATQFIMVIGGGLIVQKLDSEESFTAAELESILLRTGDIVLHGFRGTGPYREPDADRIEALSRIDASEMLPPDRIIEAISEVVAREGIWNASIDKIAGRLGMSKSSLYFYFENRDDMLRSMIEREQERKNELTRARLARCATLEEKLLCFLYTTVHYFLNNHTMLTTFNWLRFQKIPMNMDHRSQERAFRELEFVQEGLASGLLDSRGLDTRQFMQLINFLGVREVMECSMTGCDRQGTVRHLLWMYRLMMSGIEERKEGMG